MARAIVLALVLSLTGPPGVGFLCHATCQHSLPPAAGCDHRDVRTDGGIAAGDCVDYHSVGVALSPTSRATAGHSRDMAIAIEPHSLPLPASTLASRPRQIIGAPLQKRPLSTQLRI